MNLEDSIIDNIVSSTNFQAQVLNEIDSVTAKNPDIKNNPTVQRLIGDLNSGVRFIDPNGYAQNINEQFAVRLSSGTPNLVTCRATACVVYIIDDAWLVHVLLDPDTEHLLPDSLYYLTKSNATNVISKKDLNTIIRDPRILEGNMATFSTIDVFPGRIWSKDESLNLWSKLISRYGDRAKLRFYKPARSLIRVSANLVEKIDLLDGSTLTPILQNVNLTNK